MDNKLKIYTHESFTRTSACGTTSLLIHYFGSLHKSMLIIMNRQFNTEALELEYLFPNILLFLGPAYISIKNFQFYECSGEFIEIKLLKFEKVIKFCSCQQNLITSYKNPNQR